MCIRDRLYLGASNYAAYRLMESLWTSERERLERFVAFQAQYSLVVRDIEREHVPVCLKHGVGVLPWSPLAGGFLSAKTDRGAPPPPGTRLEQWKQRFAGLDTDRNWHTVGKGPALTIWSCWPRPPCLRLRFC